MREVRIRSRAQLDIESAFIYRAFELGQPKTARSIVDSLYAAFERLAQMPEMGRVFEDADLELSYRRVLVKRYWVYYTFDDSQLLVWRVFHTRQDTADYTIVDF